ncbi:hypothetical protein F2P56_003664, partial [Juglans regia]
PVASPISQVNSFPSPTSWLPQQAIRLSHSSLHRKLPQEAKRIFLSSFSYTPVPREKKTKVSSPPLSIYRFQGTRRKENLLKSPSFTREALGFPLVCRTSSSPQADSSIS